MAKCSPNKIIILCAIIAFAYLKENITFQKQRLDELRRLHIYQRNQLAPKCSTNMTREVNTITSSEDVCLDVDITKTNINSQLCVNNLLIFVGGLIILRLVI